MIRAWWADLDRGGRVLAGLVGAVVLLRLLLVAPVAGAPVYGDEAYYVDAAMALSNLLRDLASFGPVDGAELERMVVGSGWFMPGLAVVLAPLYLVAPDAPTEALRLYLAVFSTVLLLVTVRTVHRTLGRRSAAALLVFPGLVPMYAQFGFTAYGDLAAGLVLMILLCGLVRAVREWRVGISPTLRQGAVLGLLAVTALYFRSSVSVVVLGVFLGALLAGLLVTAGRDRLRVVLAMAAAGVAFLAVLAPWSVAASHSLGTRVTTTTSVSTVLANTFGDRERVCFGPCDPGSTKWFSPLRYSREVERATGVSEVELQAQMSAQARDQVTPTSYAADVVDNLWAYTSAPAGFADIVIEPGTPRAVVAVIEVSTSTMFTLALGVALALLLLVVRRAGVEAQVQALLLKLAVGALLVQPFVHIAGSRYWTTLAPLLGVGAVLLWALWWERRDPASVEPVPRGRGRTAGVLALAQAVLAAATVLVAVTLGLLAL